MRFPRTAAIATALTALLLPATAHAAPADTALRDPGQTLTAPLCDVLAQLPINAEDRAGYQRDALKHWVDADKDGCNARAEVLQAEAVIAPEQSQRCILTGGQRYSPYDDRYIDGPRGLDIDHLVPLAEAWDSGASAWSPEERAAYANDLGDDRALIAVSAASNRSKADQDPTTWLPPADGSGRHLAYRVERGAHCDAHRLRSGVHPMRSTQWGGAVRDAQLIALRAYRCASARRRSRWPVQVACDGRRESALRSARGTDPGTEGREGGTRAATEEAARQGASRGDQAGAGGRPAAGRQPPTWMPGRRAGSGSFLRMISRVTGAVSPRPRRK